MVTELNDADFKSTLESAGTPILVDFSATWCAPCKALAPTIDAVADEYAGKMAVYKVDIDNAQETAASYGIMSVPTCIFFRDGKVVATLDAGRHTLDSMNLPFLSNLVDSFTGGNVFIAEVFFVNIREHTGVKFGGRVGHAALGVLDVPVETMVHGEFSFKITDPERLIVGLVGMGRAESYQVRSWLKEQVLKVIRDRIAELAVAELLE